MSLESILERISAAGQAEKEKIIRTAQKETQELISRANQQAEQRGRQLLEREKLAAEKQREGLVVNARLKAKNALLSSKQALIGDVLKRAKEHISRTKLKKQVISYERVNEVQEEPKHYLQDIRREFESEIAKILFGKI